MFFEVVRFQTIRLEVTETLRNPAITETKAAFPYLPNG